MCPGKRAATTTGPQESARGSPVSPGWYWNDLRWGLALNLLEVLLIQEHSPEMGPHHSICTAAYTVNSIPFT